jgi:hypothetical protein
MGTMGSEILAGCSSAVLLLLCWSAAAADWTIIDV